MEALCFYIVAPVVLLFRSCGRSFRFILWNNATKTVIALTCRPLTIYIFASSFGFSQSLKTQVQHSTFVHSREHRAIYIRGYYALQNQSHADYGVVAATYWHSTLKAPYIVQSSCYHQVKEWSYLAETPSSRLGTALD